MLLWNEGGLKRFLLWYSDGYIGQNHDVIYLRKYS